jgi:hypothetical protein
MMREEPAVKEILAQVPQILLMNKQHYDSDHTGKTDVLYFDLSSRPDVRKYVLANFPDAVLDSTP